MKKLIAIIFGLTMLIGVCAITSCSKDDEVMSGVYGYITSGNKGSCYHFINHNTVMYYSSATLSTEYLNRIGDSWWTSQFEGVPYTYTFEDNKIYIPQQGDKGTIFTLTDGYLLEDGTGKKFKKGLYPN